MTEPGFRAMARSLLGVARDCAGGRCAAVLEGGYDLAAIHDSSLMVLAEFAGDTAALPASRPSRAAALLERVKSVHSRYWRL